MMLRSILEKRLTELIEEMNIDEQYSIFKEYCWNNNCYDDEPYSNDEFAINDLFYSCTPYEILEKLEGWDSSWDYFVLGVYGIEEWNGIDHYVEDVVDYIIDNENDLENGEIADLLEMFEDELEDVIYDSFEEHISETESIEEICDCVLEDIKDKCDVTITELEAEGYIDDIMEEINYLIEEMEE